LLEHSTTVNRNTMKRQYFFKLIKPQSPTAPGRHISALLLLPPKLKAGQ
jgi:hypothetical protein